MMGGASAVVIVPRLVLTGSLALVFCLPLGGASMKGDLTSFADANNKFGLDLYRQLLDSSPGDGNLFFSPLGVSSALAMTLLGIEDTAVKSVLHLDKVDDHGFHSSFQALLRTMRDSAGSANKLSVASRAFLEDDHTFLPEFTEHTKQMYGSDTARVDFASDVEGLRQRVNLWVENKTDFAVQDCAHPGIFDHKTSAVLVNAVNYKGAWQSKFQQKLVSQAKFHKLNGEVSDVDLMFQQGVFFTGKAEELGAQYLELPYSGGGLRMVLLDPGTQGLIQLERKLQHSHFRTLHEEVAVNTSMTVLIPRIKMQQSHDLKRILKTLGAEAINLTLKPSNPVANYTFNQDTSHVLHSAAIEIERDGDVGPQPHTEGRQRNKFLIKRPFLFYVQEAISGAVVFLGRVADPKPLQTNRLSLNLKEEL